MSANIKSLKRIENACIEGLLFNVALVSGYMGLYAYDDNVKCYG